MNARTLSAELNVLDGKLKRGEKLTDEEKTRQREIRRQLHSIHKKRARIYSQNPH